jgi:aminomuconate-semialdehyde/2-hydroxymuconate-6-semialdehyde dehydrogenase
MNLSIPSTIFNFIDNNYLSPVKENYLEIINPATNKVVCKAANSTSEDVDLAVAAAEKAFETWSQTSNETRFDILNKIATLIEQNIDALALAETIDNGKPLWLSTKVDIPRAAANFRFFATAIMHFASESHNMQPTAINYTLRQPIGVVGCISPWNLPLYLFTWKIAPALAAGNCVVAKPSEITPITAYLLSIICKEAGLPKGVLNIVHGTGESCGEAIVKHKNIKAISFTGSTIAGKKIASIAAPMFKKLSLELGGKNPNIIFANCNWDKMMKTTIRSSFENQGQICLCGSRILIEASIYEQFKTEFIAKTKELLVGNPLNNNNKLGAIVSEVHYNKILNCIDIAKQEGGIVLAGGYALKLDNENTNGFFIAPTIIEGLPANCATNLQEIFGPVVTLQSFDTKEEALQLANTAHYGLAASIWTNDITTANFMASKIECGIVWINTWLQRDLRTPFGGTKNSGIGREGGWEALHFFTESKNICIEN